MQATLWNRFQNKEKHYSSSQDNALVQHYYLANAVHLPHFPLLIKMHWDKRPADLTTHQQLQIWDTSLVSPDRIQVTWA